MSTTTQSVRKAITKVNQVVMLLAYLSSTQAALTGNSWNKLNLNSVVYDVGKNYDTVAFKFTAPVTGLYRIRGNVVFTSVIATERYMLSIYKNGSAIAYAYEHASVAKDLSVDIDTEVFLQQNDYIELYAQPEVGAGVDTVGALGASEYTSLLIRLVTKEGIKQ